MFFLLNASDFPSVSLLNRVEGQIKVLFNTNSDDTSLVKIVFLHCFKNSEVAVETIESFNLFNYVTGMYRDCLLHKNEQETLLSFNQQLVVIQIILHRLQMEQLSLTEIKSICHKIVERKLKRSFQIPSQERENIIDEESFSEDPDDILLRDPEKSNSFEQIFDSYESFLRSSNIVDFSDVLRSLSSELTRNSEIQEAFSSKKRAIVLINGKGFSQAEMKVISYMVNTSGECYNITTMTSLDDPNQPTQVDILPSTEAEVLGKVNVDCGGGLLRSPEFSRVVPPAEVYAKQLILSYLSLLVNSRSELDLATVVNVPDRGIDHSTFTKIKHSSASKNLSMYQAIISFVLRSRLGGKGYAPSPDDPFVPKLKGLSEFTDLFNKMHSIIEEEDSNSRSAVTRLIKLIKNTLCTSSCASSPSSKKIPSFFQQPIRRGAVESAAARIWSSFEGHFKSLESVSFDGTTPTRLITEGASLNGRRTIRIIRNVLDLYCSDDDELLVADTVLTQTGTTPLRSLPSLASKFRSPEATIAKLSSPQSAKRVFAQNHGTNKGIKRHLSTPNKSSTPHAQKKPRPLFSRSFSSPSENKENVPPGTPGRQPQKPQTKATGVKRQATKKAPKTSKRGLFGAQDIDKKQTTLKQFFH